MRRLKTFLLLTALTLTGCNGENWTWREKIKVSVETPDGLKIGSSVLEVKLADMSKAWLTTPESRGATERLTGEAVVVEVAPGRYLFALLKALPSAYVVFFPKHPPLEDAAAKLASMRESRTLASDQYPLLVTFDDINDPASVKKVDPGHLAATFGPGYRLASITMTMTDEAVTKGKVEAQLDWWTIYLNNKARMISLRYPDKSPRGYDTLTPLDFWSLNSVPN